MTTLINSACPVCLNYWWMPESETGQPCKCCRARIERLAVYSHLNEDVKRLTAEVERLRTESDRFRVVLMHYAERNYWGYSEPLSPNKIEDLFIPSRATGEPGWQRAEEALK